MTRTLRADALTLADSAVMAVAGSAPAYSIAATTAALVAAAGVAGPASLLYCGIPMIGIAWAFSALNRFEANAGASYAWVARVLHPALGFLAGWSLVVSATLFMVAAALPAGSMTLGLFSAALAGNTGLVIAVGAAWFTAMVTVSVLGVGLSARVQRVMTGTEVMILLVAAGLALAHAAARPYTPFSWTWFGPGHFDGTAGFAAGALVATFYFWGWDVSSNLGEETRDGRRSAGLGGIIGLLTVFALFETYTIAVTMSLPPAVVGAHPGNVLAVLGDAAWPAAGGKLLTIAVMLSTVGTVQTTLIQVTRTLFAMSRERTLPACLSRLHPRRDTPWVAAAVIGVIGLSLFALSAAIGSVGAILADTIGAVGLEIAVYYGLAGITAVVAFRRVLLRSARNFVLMGLWPLGGAGFMFWVLAESVPAHRGIVDVCGLGALGLGLVPLGVYWARGSPYFSRRRPDLAGDMRTGHDSKGVMPS